MIVETEELEETKIALITDSYKALETSKVYERHSNLINQLYLEYLSEYQSVDLATMPDTYENFEVRLEWICQQISITRNTNCIALI